MLYEPSSDLLAASNCPFEGTKNVSSCNIGELRHIPQVFEGEWSKLLRKQHGIRLGQRVLQANRSHRRWNTWRFIRLLQQDDMSVMPARREQLTSILPEIAGDPVGRRSNH